MDVNTPNSVLPPSLSPGAAEPAAPGTYPSWWRLPAHVTTAGLGLATAVAGYVPAWVVAWYVVLVGVFLALSWPQLLALPSPRGTSAVLVAMAVSAAVLPMVSAPDHRTRWIVAAMSTGLLFSFLHQLLRSDGRGSLTVSLAGTAFALGVLGSGAGLVAAAHGTAAFGGVVPAGGFVALGAAVALGAMVDYVVPRTNLGTVLVGFSGAIAGLAAVFTEPSLSVSWIVFARYAVLGILSALVSMALRSLVFRVGEQEHIPLAAARSRAGVERKMFTEVLAVAASSILVVGALPLLLF